MLIRDSAHNNLKLYNVLVQTPFTTSTTELGMRYKKNYIQLAYNYEQLVSSFHCRIELLALALTKHTITGPKSFRCSISLLYFLIFLKIFCKEL